MWQYSDFRESFEQFNPTPPEKVWRQLSLHLEEDRKKSMGFWEGFNRAQKLTIVAASLVSFLVSSFIFKQLSPRNDTKYSDIEHEELPNSTLVTTLPKVNPIKKSGNLTQSIQGRKEMLISEKTKNIQQPFKSPIHDRNLETKITPQNLEASIIQPEEILPFLSDIKEIAQLDKQIKKLAEEIAYIDSKKPLVEKSLEEISLINEPINFTMANKNELETYFRNNNNALHQDENRLDTTKTYNFFSHLYLTPIIGGNFTQITYTGSPNSPYFTENASFTGKIGYNFGVQLGYEFSKHWSIESGLSFGQYIQSFKEQKSSQNLERKGEMYIDQLDIPLLARFSIPFGDKEYPKTFSLKSGLQYSSVIRYQVNFTDKYLSPITTEKVYHIEADKRNYNSLQLGYAFGFDFDAFLNKRISMNLSLLNVYTSQLENFPTFNTERNRPKQFSTSFSIGTKIHF